MNGRTRLMLDLALVRTLLDEVERGLHDDEGLTSQLVDELQRLAANVAQTHAPRSGTRLREVG